MWSESEAYYAYYLISLNIIVLCSNIIYAGIEPTSNIICAGIEPTSNIICAGIEPSALKLYVLDSFYTWLGVLRLRVELCTE
jgi:hypothetical protein